MHIIRARVVSLSLIRCDSIGVGSAWWRNPTPLIFYLIARCSWDLCTCGRWSARLCVPSRGNSFARSGRRIVEYSDCVCYGQRREAVSPGVCLHGVKLRHSLLFVHFSCFCCMEKFFLRPLSGWLYLLHLLVYPCSSPLDKHDVSSEGQRDLGLALSTALRFGVGIATVSA
jgi:hypothetical protein